jgi:hypothetical protein
MRIYKFLPILALSAFALVGLNCPPPGGGSDDTGGDDTGATGGDDTGGTVGGFDGTITGDLRVQLYDIDTDGEYVYKDWSVWDGNFPFGSIWVYAFNTDESTGDEIYYANQSILTPSVDGDAYSLTFSASAANVRIGAQLDFYADGVMGTSDPVGIYPDRVSVTDGSTASGVDITILAYWNNSGGGGCDGSGGGNGDGSSTISGDIIITEAYAAGDAVAMLFSNGAGPYGNAMDILTPEPSGGGAEGSYSFDVCASWGELDLIGVWDSNFNSLFDADDKAGPYISEPDLDGNPVDVSTNLEEHDIQIPMGDYNIDIVPFVNLSGTITHIDGAFSGGTVTVGSLKYKPDDEFSATDIGDVAYDYMEFDTSGGETSFDYSVDVPSNTIVYLLAWDNEDGDGLLNESDEAVGSGSSSSNGRLPTGSTSQVIDISLAPYSD